MTIYKFEMRRSGIDYVTFTQKDMPSRLMRRGAGLCWDRLSNYWELPASPRPITLCVSTKPVKGKSVYPVQLSKHSNVVIDGNVHYILGFTYAFLRERIGDDVRKVWVWIELPA